VHSNNIEKFLNQDVFTKVVKCHKILSLVLWGNKYKLSELSPNNVVSV